VTLYRRPDLNQESPLHRDVRSTRSGAIRMAVPAVALAIADRSSGHSVGFDAHARCPRGSPTVLSGAVRGGCIMLA